MLVNKHTSTRKRVATDHHIPFTGIKKKFKTITKYDDGLDFETFGETKDCDKVSDFSEKGIPPDFEINSVHTSNYSNSDHAHDKKNTGRR